MYSFILLTAIISFISGEPRSPKIYNVLISSKKNLAPSQALPVYEPVLRTTSLGYAFSPFVYTHFGSLPAATTYIQQPLVNVHNVRQPDTSIYHTHLNSEDNSYAQQQPPRALPDERFSNQLLQTNGQRTNPYPQQRPAPFLREQVPPNHLPQVDQPRSTIYAQQAGIDINEVKQPTGPVYQTQQSISDNNNPQQHEPVPALQGITPSNQLPQVKQQIPSPYTDSAPGDKSLPSNVIPLEQYVPYYAPLTYQQYLPRIEPVHIQTHPVPLQQPVNYQSAGPAPQSRTYDRSEQISQEPTTNGRHSSIPAQPLTYEKLFDGNQAVNPKQIIANFKRNPGIADVPPPPLPVKTS